MIKRLWPLTLLVVQLALGFDHSIDLDRCKSAAKDTACFVRKSCIDAQTGDNVLVQLKDETLNEEGKCDVVLQIEVLTDKKMHVMMQANAKSGEKLKKDEGLKLNQGTTLFHCKPGSITPTTGFTFEIKGAQTFTNERTFCSFTVKLTSFIQNINTGSQDKPTLVIPKDNTDILEYSKEGDDIWVYTKLTSSTCDSTKVTSPDKPGSSSDIELMEVDTTLPILSCAKGDLDLEVSGSPATKVAKVFCEGTKWFKEIEGVKEQIGDEFKVYCSQKRCLRCTDENKPSDLSFTDCVKIDFKGSPDPATCPTLKCPSTFTVDGSSTFAGAAECKKSVAKSVEYAWFVGETELTVFPVIFYHLYAVLLLGGYGFWLKLTSEQINYSSQPISHSSGRRAGTSGVQRPNRTSTSGFRRYTTSEDRRNMWERNFAEGPLDRSYPLPPSPRLLFMEIISYSNLPMAQEGNLRVSIPNPFCEALGARSETRIATRSSNIHWSLAAYVGQYQQFMVVNYRHEMNDGSQIHLASAIIDLYEIRAVQTTKEYELRPGSGAVGGAEAFSGHSEITLAKCPISRSGCYEFITLLSGDQMLVTSEGIHAEVNREQRAQAFGRR